MTIRNITLTAVLLLLTITGCSKGEYAETEKLLKGMLNVTEQFIMHMEKAEDGKSIAEAITSYRIAKTKLEMELTKQMELHPELNSLTPPEELSKYYKSMEELQEPTLRVLMKATAFIDDENVRQVFEQMNGSL